MPTMTGSEPGPLRMAEFAFGDVLLVPFPFTDQTTTKQRPAVVVSSDAYHRERPDLIILAVTSQVRPQKSFAGQASRDHRGPGPIEPVAELGDDRERLLLSNAKSLPDARLLHGPLDLVQLLDEPEPGLRQCDGERSVLDTSSKLARD